MSKIIRGSLLCSPSLPPFLPSPLSADAPSPHSNTTNISYKETKQRIILSLLYTLHTKHTIQLFYLLSSETSSTWILNCADLLLITNRREKIEKKNLCCWLLLYFHGLHKSGGFFILGGVVKYQNGKWKSMVTTSHCCQLFFGCHLGEFQGKYHSLILIIRVGKCTISKMMEIAMFCLLETAFDNQSFFTYLSILYVVGDTKTTSS